MGNAFERMVVNLNDGLYDDGIATNLAEMFDRCENDGKLDGQQAAWTFATSCLAKQFE